MLESFGWSDVEVQIRLFVCRLALLKSSIVRLFTDLVVWAWAVNNQLPNPPNVIRHKNVSGNSHFLRVSCICVFMSILLETSILSLFILKIKPAVRK